MKHYPLIFIAALGWATLAGAQVPEGGSSSMPPEQWQLTLDVIKSRAQTLVVENNGLQGEYRQLMVQAQRLQQGIREQQEKNEQLARLLKDRHGRTDQQARMEDLNQTIRTKTQQAKAYEDQLVVLRKKQLKLDGQIQQLKYTISDIDLHRQGEKVQQTQGIQTDDHLAPLRKQLEDETKQEVVLENQLSALKNGGGQNLSQASAKLYGYLRAHKQQLEAQIYTYELHMDQLRRSSLTALSWSAKKKKLLRQMIQMDSRNNKIRGTIKMLREDIDVLRDQVAALERRLNFAKGKTI